MTRLRAGLALAIATVLVICVGASVWAVNRFVLDHVEISDVAAYESANASQATAASEDDSAKESTQVPTDVTDTTFANGNAAGTITTVTSGSGNDAVTYYVADVVLSDATALRSAFAENKFGLNIIEKTSEIAAANGAIFAINGDYYGFRDTGIVIRNGVIYRDEPARIGLAFYRDGTAEVYDETTTDAQQLLDAGVWNTLSFGPALVENGQIISGIDEVEVDTNFGNHSIQGEQPRTAVGIIDTNHLIFVVVDGRDAGYSRGVTLSELAQIMRDLGATTAYNLDGGGSSTFYFNGEVLNQPSNNGERGTSDILYVAG